MDMFGLINMNGRMYDPIIGRMLSPDPYVPNGAYTQDFNRYTYARNNPLSYIDPDGESVLLATVLFAGWLNLTMNAHKADNVWQGLGYFAVGAGAAALGAGVGAGISSAIAGTGFGAGFIGSSTALTASSSFLSGAAIGGGAGFASGFTMGFGNGLLGGQNIGQTLGQGGLSGLIAGGSGALLGGIAGGIQGRRETLIFRRGMSELGIDGGGAVPATDKFLLDAQRAWFPDAPMNKVGNFTTENIPSHVKMIDKAGNPAYGRTIPRELNGKFSGISDVYFSKSAFSSAKQLFVTMGHEFVHVNQFAALAGYSYSLLNNKGFVEVIELQAYNYQNRFIESQGSSFNNNLIRNFMRNYPNTYNQLNYDAIYRGLPRILPF